MAVVLPGLTADSSPDEIKEVWRTVARQHHPDHGGDPATFQAYHKAYIEALHNANAAKCLNCDKGKVLKQRGFSSVAIICDSCGGTGKRWPRKNVSVN